MQTFNRRTGFLVTIMLIILPLIQTSCTSGQTQNTNSQPPLVEVLELKQERVVLTTELPGRTSAFLVAEIRPQVNGLIQKRLFTEGSLVKAGEVLYQIDPAQYRAAFEQAKAAVAMSEATLPALRSREERFKELLNINAVGQQDYDDALAALQQAEAQLLVNKAAMDAAKINLNYTPIQAPITGRIGKSTVTVGAMVTAYQPVPLATIKQMDPIYVDVTQSAGDLLALERKMAKGELTADGESRNRVHLILQDGSRYAHAGTLQFRDVSVEATTGAVTLRVVVPNPEQTLLPGMFVQAIVEEGVAENGILVPQQAISRNPKGMPYAFVVNADNSVSQRYVTLNREVGNRWLIADGLQAGEKVVVNGLQRVRDGVTVSTEPWQDNTQPPADTASGREN